MKEIRTRRWPPKPGDWVLFDRKKAIGCSRNSGTLEKLAKRICLEEGDKSGGLGPRFTYCWRYPQKSRYCPWRKAAILTIDGLVRMNGFKVKARLIADKLGLAGIAWNLPDDRRVGIIVEGRKGVIKEFIEKLHIHETGILYIDVKSIRTKWVRSTGLYNPGLNIIRNPDTLEYLMTMRRRLLSGYKPDLTVLDS